MACAVFAAAGWASRAELDEVVGDAVRQRIALVPSWQPFVAFLALAALGVVALATLVARVRRRDAADAMRVGVVVLPVFGLLALLVPYLPVVPDWWPVLQVPAGPGFWIVWVLVATQLVWVLWPQLKPLAAWAGRRDARAQMAAIWIATAAAAGVGAGRLTHTVLFPSGDEPHYLVLAQSLWRDGDLEDREQPHARGLPGVLRATPGSALPRARVGWRDLSVHPVGMPVLITPVYAAGGYDLVVAFFVVMAATAATVAWRWVSLTTGNPGATTLAWAAIVFSAPFLINAFTIYPEVPAALVVAVAVMITLRPTPDRRSWHDVAVGVLAGLLPWLSTKYAPMSAAIVAVAVARVWWPLHATERPDRTLASLVRVGVPYAVCLVGWFAYFYAYWGTPWPSAPYGTMTQTELAHTLFGVPGLFFDQEYGLLAYAPAYVLAGMGLWTMMRRRGALRRVGLEVAVIVGALAFTVGAFRIWWGGSAAPGRPLVSGLLPLMLPLAVQIGSAATAPARRAAQHLLVWLGTALCAVLIVAQEGLLVANGRDGTSSLLEWLSPRWPLWNLAPTFIAHEAFRAMADVAVWLLAVWLGSWVLGRVRARSRGGASLAAMAGAVAVVIVGAGGMRLLPATPTPLPGIDLRARSRLGVLDTFDHVTRPVALRYAPVRIASAGEIESTLAVSVSPGLRTQPQPLRVLHNGRFSLPAGRYRAIVQWATLDPLPARAGSRLGLQVGRIGEPLRQWTVSPAPGGTWQDEFWLPIDAGFVGFRGTPELERSIAELRVEAVDVVDAGARTPTPQVLASAQYGPLVVAFHDEALHPETGGFWITGARLARITIACPDGCSRGVVLRVHSGKRPNHLRLDTHGWSHEVDLVGEQVMTIAVPPPAAGGVIALEARTTTGFIPMDVDPTIRDRRYLGAWIEPAAAPEEPR